jgi:O-antigen/teichoic acid export membrane protein
MAGATVLAGGLDYVFQVFTGRLLTPAEFSIFIAVTAILQIMVYMTNSIRNVVAYYTAGLTTSDQPLVETGRFMRRSWRWAARWGVVALLVAVLLSPLLARWLRVPSVLPFLAAALAVLMLFLRPVSDGALQGVQFFAGLGTVQVLQAGLRLVVGALLLFLGWQAFGAILALPLAMAGGLVLAMWLLRPRWQAGRGAAGGSQVSWNYSLLTLAGLLCFALMINLDAIVVKRVFSPEIAGNYGPVVTLGKMNLFIPLAIGQVLFPKVTQRQATGRDARPILLLALVVTMLPGLLLTIIFWLVPGFLVQTIFGGAYRDPGLVLAVVGLATTLFAGLNIWLNYALSAKQPLFVGGLALALLMQIIGLALFHDSLLQVAIVTCAAGLIGNGVGVLTNLLFRPVKSKAELIT